MNFGFRSFFVLILGALSVSQGFAASTSFPASAWKTIYVRGVVQNDGVVVQEGDFFDQSRDEIHNYFEHCEQNPFIENKTVTIEGIVESVEQDEHPDALTIVILKERTVHKAWYSWQSDTITQNTSYFLRYGGHEVQGSRFNNHQLLVQFLERSKPASFGKIIEEVTDETKTAYQHFRAEVDPQIAKVVEDTKKYCNYHVPFQKSALGWREGKVALGLGVIVALIRAYWGVSSAAKKKVAKKNNKKIDREKAEVEELRLQIAQLFKADKKDLDFIDGELARADEQEKKIEKLKKKKVKISWTQWVNSINLDSLGIKTFYKNAYLPLLLLFGLQTYADGVKMFTREDKKTGYDPQNFSYDQVAEEWSTWMHEQYVALCEQYEGLEEYVNQMTWENIQQDIINYVDTTRRFLVDNNPGTVDLLCATGLTAYFETKHLLKQEEKRLEKRSRKMTLKHAIKHRWNMLGRANKARLGFSFVKYLLLCKAVHVAYDFFRDPCIDEQHEANKGRLLDTFYTLMKIRKVSKIK